MRTLYIVLKEHTVRSEKVLQILYTYGTHIIHIRYTCGTHTIPIEKGGYVEIHCKTAV